MSTTVEPNHGYFATGFETMNGKLVPDVTIYRVVPAGTPGAEAVVMYSNGQREVVHLVKENYTAPSLSAE